MHVELAEQNGFPLRMDESRIVSVGGAGQAMLGTATKQSTLLSD